MKNRIARIGLVGVIALVAVGGVGAFPAVELGVSGAAGSMDGETVGQATVEGAVRVTTWLDVRVDATAVHTLERSYKDADGNAYQAEAGWSTAGLRPFVTLGERVEIGVPLSSGAGTLQFRYERPHRDEVAWTEEILDRETFGITTAGLDVVVRVSDRWSVVVEGGGRTTSPLRPVVDFDRSALNGWYAGIGTTYRIK